MVTAPGSRRRHQETRRGGSPWGGSSQPAPTKPAAMGSPQRPPLAHVFKGTFVHSRASAPMDILHGHLLGVDDNGTVSRGSGGLRASGEMSGGRSGSAPGAGVPQPCSAAGRDRQGPRPGLARAELALCGERGGFSHSVGAGAAEKGFGIWGSWR